MYVRRCMIVTAAQQALAQGLAAGLAGAAGAGMWTTSCSPTGAAPATHFITEGMIDDTFAALLADPNLLYAQCQAAGAAVTLAQCQTLLSTSDISTDPPFTALARLGLKLIQPALP